MSHHQNGNVPPSDSLASMCWPIIQKERPTTVLDKLNISRQPPNNEVAWPVSEPWRANLEGPRCAGQGRCQGKVQLCNSKYRYGVDDRGQCPEAGSCAVTCNPCPPGCANPCPEQKGCHRLTTRCYDWPRPRIVDCGKEDLNVDPRGPRPDLNDPNKKPQVCPTCFRTVVDMQCGPLGMNYS